MPRREPRPRIVIWVIIVESGLILLALLVGELVDASLLDRFDAGWEGLLAGILATIPLIVAGAWSMRTAVRPFPQVRRDVEQLVLPLFRGATWIDFALIALLAGLGEEALFRGLIQPGLARWLGIVPAILLTSLLFGAVHWVTPMYALLAGAIGVYLGLFALVSGNLLVPIIIHALYDFIALAYLMKRPGAGDNVAAADQSEVRV